MACAIQQAQDVAIRAGIVRPLERHRCLQPGGDPHREVLAGRHALKMQGAFVHADDLVAAENAQHEPESGIALRQNEGEYSRIAGSAHAMSQVDLAPVAEQPGNVHRVAIRAGRGIPANGDYQGIVGGLLDGQVEIGAAPARHFVIRIGAGQARLQAGQAARQTGQRLAGGTAGVVHRAGHQQTQRPGDRRIRRPDFHLVAPAVRRDGHPVLKLVAAAQQGDRLAALVAHLDQEGEGERLPLGRVGDQQRRRAALHGEREILRRRALRHSHLHRLTISQRCRRQGAPPLQHQQEVARSPIPAADPQQVDSRVRQDGGQIRALRLIVARVPVTGAQDHAVRRDQIDLHVKRPAPAFDQSGDKIAGAPREAIGRHRRIRRDSRVHPGAVAERPASLRQGDVGPSIREAEQHNAEHSPEQDQPNPVHSSVVHVRFSPAQNRQPSIGPKVMSALPLHRKPVGISPKAPPPLALP